MGVGGGEGVGDAREGYRLCLPSVLSLLLLWLFGCLCLSFSLILEAWCDSDCVGSRVQLFTFLFTITQTYYIVLLDQSVEKHSTEHFKAYYHQYYCFENTLEAALNTQQVSTSLF